MGVGGWLLTLAAETGVTLTSVTVGSPKVSAGSVSLNPLAAAAVTSGALELVVMAVVFTITLPAVMLLMTTCDTHASV